MNNNLRKSIKGLWPFCFYQNLEYYTNDSNGSILFSNNKPYLIKERSLYITNHLAKRYLTSVNSYFKALKEVISSKYNNPLYLDLKMILIASKGIKEYENIWINFSNIKNFEISNKQTIIIFHSGNKLSLNVGKNYLVKQINKIKEIESYLKKVRWKRIYHCLLIITNGYPKSKVL